MSAWSTCWKVAFTAFEVLAFGAVIYVTVSMIAKTEDDLALYREHSRINDTLLTAMTGIQWTAAQVIERGHPGMRGSSDYERSSRKNRAIFTRRFYTIAVMGGIFACAVALVKLWM